MSSVIPADQIDAVHQEIANHINDGLQSQAAAQGGVGGLLPSLENDVTSGSPVPASEGELLSSLASKFGRSPAVTGAISGALPGLLQSLYKANDPNENSVTPKSIQNSIDGNLSNLL